MELQKNIIESLMSDKLSDANIFLASILEEKAKEAINKKKKDQAKNICKCDDDDEPEDDEDAEDADDSTPAN